MILEKEEYTVRMLIDYLNHKFGGKITGEKFTHNDVAQYIKRKMLPYRYGGHTIKVIKTHDITTVKLIETSNA